MVVFRLTIREIGRGKFGIVNLVEETQTQTRMASKEMNYSNGKEQQMVKTEVSTLKETYQISREHLFSSQSNDQSSSQQLKFIPIVEPLDFFLSSDKNKAYLVMEYCEGGDLHQFIEEMKKSKTQLSREDACDYIEQIASAIYLLHSVGIIHGDIKPSNVLIKDGKIKLADFGLARKLKVEKDQIEIHGGTILYLAPELLLHKTQEMKQSFKADIWAIGALLYELLELNHPYVNEKDLYKRIDRWRMLSLIYPKEPKVLPMSYPLNIRNLIKKMLIKNPAKRIAAKEILEEIKKVKSQGNQ
ncbi:MAG: putative NEK protein kinase [Streblomastix strix]|uniref:non-specific serine/threonine protein kinase n=1 Tax=Streblomastix strix TaxID=222440 RepID=A0A5J4WG59_9EUKA|nr:MAG: putative NEK protein kinase [Streblomastix strix]